MRVGAPLVRGCPFCGFGKICVSNTHTAWACYSATCEACGAEVSGPSRERLRWKTPRGKVSSHVAAIRALVRVWNRRHEVPAGPAKMFAARIDSHVYWGAGAQNLDLSKFLGDEESARCES